MEPDDLTQDQSAIPAPPISTDNLGDDSQPGPQPTQSAIPDGGAETFGGDRPAYAQDNGMLPINAAASGAKSLVGYIMGQGAAPQQQAEAAARQVDPEGRMSPDERNLLAVHRAAEMGGPGAAWAMVQANRQAYNGKQAFARAALNGVDGKAGDLAAAADAATKASAHLLDGSTAVFHPQEDGVVADVRPPGQKESIQIKLTPDQFNEYLDVGKGGQFDKVLHNGGVPQTLQQIAQGPGEPLPGAPLAGSPGQRPGRSQESINAEFAQPGNKTGHMLPKNLYERADQDAEDGLAPEPEAPETDPKKIRDNEEYDAIAERAKKIFPHDSQMARRQQWQQEQEAAYKDRQNRTDVAIGSQEAKKEVARITGTAGVEKAQTYSSSKERINQEKMVQQAKLQADRLVAQAQNAADRNRAQNFRAALTNPNFVLQTPEDVAKLTRQYGVTLPQQAPPGETPDVPTGQPLAAPTGAPKAAPTGQAGAPPQPGMKFFNGKWYTRDQYRQEFGR